MPLKRTLLSVWPNRQGPRWPRWQWTACGMLACGCLFGLVGCSTNPATGRSQLTLVSEAQEQQIGLQNAEQVAQAMPAYDDPALSAYVDGIGQTLAARSERPGLPWQFTVVDDTAINAFALPGGYIYVTRGILAWFNSEAELATVLGHEIGHVTGRHSVERLSRTQLAQLGLGVGGLVYSPIADFSGLISQGLGVLFLKYSRDDEREADMLGLRYMSREGYDPESAVRVFEMLGAQRNAGERDGTPNWLATHPTPEDRSERLQKLIDERGASSAGTRTGQTAYLQKIDGLMFGENPRAGFFEGEAFYHPDLAFTVQFPQGWQHQNLAQAVISSQPDGRAAVQLTAAPGPLEEVVAAFRKQNGISAGRARSIPGPLAGQEFSFRAQTAQGNIAGLARFVAHDGLTFRLLGLTAPASFEQFAQTFSQSLASFAELTDPEKLARQPQRIRIFETDRPTSLAALYAERPAAIELETLARLNGIKADAQLAGGTALKWVE